MTSCRDVTTLQIAQRVTTIFQETLARGSGSCRSMRLVYHPVRGARMARGGPPRGTAGSRGRALKRDSGNVICVTFAPSFCTPNGWPPAEPLLVRHREEPFPLRRR